jgi:hypothetical protein
MFNAKAFRKAGGYLAEERHAEDFGLWGRLIEMGDFVAVSRRLVRFRMHERSVSRQNLDEQNLLRDSIANRHCRQFMRLNETDAARAMRVLRAKRPERAPAEWRWFLFECAPRLRWKSAEMIAWLAWRTLPFGAS